MPSRRARWWCLWWLYLLGEDIGGSLPHCCYTNSQRVHRGFLPVGKTHKRSIRSDRKYGEFSLLLLLKGDEWGAQFGWIMARRVYGYLIMQPPNMVKLNQFIKVWSWGHFS
jgi:hypothetical protein